MQFLCQVSALNYLCGFKMIGPEARTYLEGFSKVRAKTSNAGNGASEIGPSAHRIIYPSVHRNET